MSHESSQFCDLVSLYDYGRYGVSPCFFRKSDIWSLGLCLYFMASGRLPRRFGDYEDLKGFAKAVRSNPVTCHGPSWDTVDDQAQDMIRQCLAIEKSLRPAAMLLLKSSWFRDVTSPSCLGNRGESEVERKVS